MRRVAKPFSLFFVLRFWCGTCLHSVRLLSVWFHSLSLSLYLSFVIFIFGLHSFFWDFILLNTTKLDLIFIMLGKHYKLERYIPKMRWINFGGLVWGFRKTSQISFIHFGLVWRAHIRWESVQLPSIQFIHVALAVVDVVVIVVVSIRYKVFLPKVSKREPVTKWFYIHRHA